MNDLELYRRLSGSEIPVLTNAQMAAILGSTRSRTAIRMNRLVEKEVVIRVMRGRYALPSTDPICMASFIYTPSYVSLWSALRYRNATTQIPLIIDVVNTTFSGNMDLDTESGKYLIRFIKTSADMMFGSEKVRIGGHVAFVAELEKALIDGLVHPDRIPFAEMIPASRMVRDPEKMMRYAKMTVRRSVVKRCGYLLEMAGHQVKKPEHLSNTYVKLDPMGSRRGKYDRRWRIIDNVVLS